MNRIGGETKAKLVAVSGAFGLWKQADGANVPPIPWVMKTRYSYSRRQFLGTAASTAFLFTYLPSRVWGANERIQIAGIGVGGKGSSDIDQAGNVGKVVALCDIDLQRLNDKGSKFTDAKKFSDFREMLTQMGDQIDAVTVSTPDHTHAPAALMAMSMGKHAYVQKPLTHSVYEARRLRQVAAAKGVATQMGNQGTAADGLRRAVELVRGGVIGPVREVHVWTNRPVWPQAPGITTRPREFPAIPDHVKWDDFLGPAPWRPYHPAYHPFNWRGWWDFGTGAMGDMGCHTANMAFMALKLGYPTRVSAKSAQVNPETYPAWATVEYDFPAREEMPPCKLFWYEGKFPNGAKNLPPKDYLYGQQPPGSGLLIVGDKGTLYSPNDYGAAYTFFPERDFVGYVGPDPYLARNGRGDQGMKDEWAAAIKGGPKPFSNFDYAGMLTEAILLGNVAVRIGGAFSWDGPNMRSPDSARANQFLSREYRGNYMA